MKENGKIEIYQSPDGHTEVQVTFDEDTVWLWLFRSNGASDFGVKVPFINQLIINNFNINQAIKGPFPKESPTKFIR